MRHDHIKVTRQGGRNNTIRNNEKEQKLKIQCKMGKYDYYRPTILQKKRKKGNDSSNTCIMTTSRLSDKGVRTTPPGRVKDGR